MRKMGKAGAGLVVSPPPPPEDQNMQEMMELFVDVDQFLLADKHVTQCSHSQFTSLVNTAEHDTTFSSNDDHETHNHSSEVKFNDAWDLLNAMESDSHASFESILNCISTMDKPLLETNMTINTPGLDVSALLSNEPILPFDVSTPDVDTTILTSDIPEFFSNSMLDKCESPTPTEIPIIDKQVRDKESSYQSLEQTLASNANDSILRLNIGQSLDKLVTGNGAQLQLKRKASQAIKIENVKTEGELKSENVMTIIIKFGDEDEERDEESSLKRRRSEDKYDKYDEMRRKNNEASKRCRQNRKSKQSDMEKLAEQLEADNKKLSETVAKLEKEIQTTRAQFIQIFQSKFKK